MVKNTYILALLVWAIGVCTNSAPGVQKHPDINEATVHPYGLTSAGIRHLQRIDPNLTGEGIKMILISRSLTYVDEQPQNDYQPWIDHPCLDVNTITFSDFEMSEGGISPHSTAICSILLGQDSNAFNSTLGQINYQGVVPSAELEVIEFWHFLSNEVFDQSQPDANILIAAMGSQFDDWWTRGIDALVEKYGLTIIGAIGNGKDAHDPPLYPAASANSIAVGVVDSVHCPLLETSLKHFALAYPEHSTYGPTMDERCKPDIIAPGNLLIADTNDEDLYRASGNFTSYSTPVVAGTAALLLQKGNEDPNMKPLLSSKHANCIIKSILLNSADKLPFWHKGKTQKDDDHQVPLDYLQGAGMLNAEQAFLHLTAGQQNPGDVSSIGWDLNQLPKTKSDGRLYRIQIKDPNDSIITATLNWNKHYQTTYPFHATTEDDANLRLELWAVNPDDSNDHYLLDYSDSKNDNVEHLYTATDPNYTSYEIIIINSAFEDPENGDVEQSFAVAWNTKKMKQSDNIFWYDLNADGIVNEKDFVKLLENWLNTHIEPDFYFMGDINGNGIVDTNDFKALMDNENRRSEWYQEPNPE